MLALFIRFAHGKCSLWSRQAASLLCAHYVRVIHSLRSWEVLPLVALNRFAVVSSLRSRYSFAPLMGNAPFGRVIHSFRSWEVLPLVALNRFAVVSSLRSRYSFAPLMGSAPFGRVKSLRCC